MATRVILGDILTNLGINHDEAIAAVYVAYNALHSTDVHTVETHSERVLAYSRATQARIAAEQAFCVAYDAYHAMA
jgi:hypothetical protein